ncbi:MAG: CPBP family intramembrane metalloprotease [Oscillospiraceae bacterium]|nr:CPBP family intramembrane metalloprotease [Oscillospiraceae bacterium]
MAKKAPYMKRSEKVLGTAFFAVYLLVLPLVADKVFDFVAVLLDMKVSDTLANALYYYALFALSVLIFHGFLSRTSVRFLDNLSRSLATVVIGLLAFYGANELIYRVAHALFDSRTNLNDTTIAAAVHSAPRMTALIIIFLAPFVEEVLFRGLVFGVLRERGKLLAYGVSCALFAFMHVWTFALSAWDLSYFVLMLQYLVPGLVFAWCYDHAGNLWTPILLHATVNALSLLVISG